MCGHFQILIITTQEDNLTSTSRIDVLLRNCTGQNCTSVTVSLQAINCQLGNSVASRAIMQLYTLTQSVKLPRPPPPLNSCVACEASQPIILYSRTLYLLLLPLLPCFCCHATPQSFLLPFFFFLCMQTYITSLALLEVSPILLFLVFFLSHKLKCTISFLSKNSIFFSRSE